VAPPVVETVDEGNTGQKGKARQKEIKENADRHHSIAIPSQKPKHNTPTGLRDKNWRVEDVGKV